MRHLAPAFFLFVVPLAACCVLLACGDDDVVPTDGGPTRDGDPGIEDGGMVDPDGGESDGGGDAGETPSDGGFDAGAPIASLDEVLDVLCPPIARILCTAPYDCGCPYYGVPGDPAECVASGSVDCRLASAKTARSVLIESGRIATDLVALEGCMAALEESYGRCSGVMKDLEERCMSAFLDLGADLGDPCIDALCAGGAGFCAGSSGLCEPLPAAGETCEIVCAPGSVCVRGRCASLGTSGSSCGTDADCADGLACAGGACRTLVAIGGTCTATEDCALGGRCTGGLCVADAASTCVDDSTCAALELCGEEVYEGRCRARVGLGSPCDSTLACDGGRCDFMSGGVCAPYLGGGETCGDFFDCTPDLVCAFAGSCTAPGSVGDACVEGFGTNGCMPGLGCVSRVCQPLPTAGDFCDDLGACAPGLACRVEVDGARCGVPRALGEACMGDSECGPDAICDFFMSGTCVARGGEGTPCFGDPQCVDGLVCLFDPFTGEGLCGPRAPIGDRCDGEVCSDGAYCRYEPAPRSCEARICNEIFLLDRVDVRPPPVAFAH